MDSLQLTATLDGGSKLGFGCFDGFLSLSSREQLRLLDSLMRQESLSALLQAFAAWIACQLPVCRLDYHHGETHMPLLVRHDGGCWDQCCQLEDANRQPVGELSYRLGRALQSHEQSLLHQVHQLLIQPLRLFLRLEEMNRLSRQDHLTGIGNRAYFEEALHRAIGECGRHRHGLSLVLLDLDKFKQINDTHGHPVGDAVLKLFARLLSRSIRGTDLAFRLGGDEFALLLQSADKLAASRVEARLNQHLLAQPERQQWRIGYSLGHAQWEPGLSAQEFYQLADLHLYARKAWQA